MRVEGRWKWLKLESNCVQSPSCSRRCDPQPDSGFAVLVVRMTSCWIFRWVSLRLQRQGYETLYHREYTRYVTPEETSGSPGRRNSRKSVAEIYLQVFTLMICRQRNIFHSLIIYWYTNHCSIRSSCHVYVSLCREYQASRALNLGRRPASAWPHNSSGTSLETLSGNYWLYRTFPSLNFPNVNPTLVSA